MKPLSEWRVLVTGAGGFLGANLVRYLVDRVAEVHAVMRSSTDDRRIRDVSARLVVHRADVREAREFSEVFGAVRPEVVFHMAAQGGHARNGRERREHLLSAVEQMFTILEEVRGSDVQRLVCAGSSLEYGPRERPLREDDNLWPATFRGACKGAATLLCRQAVREGLPVTILRPLSVYGYGEQPNRFIPVAIRSFLRGEPL